MIYKCNKINKTNMSIHSLATFLVLKCGLVW